jgi:hypothetical protein
MILSLLIAILSSLLCSTELVRQNSLKDDVLAIFTTEILSTLTKFSTVSPLFNS